MPSKGQNDAHPRYEDMLIECITETKDRAGVSRPTIKKFLSDNYSIDPESKTTSHFISQSLKKGIDNKIFVCPKGITGKVKLAPAKKRSSSDSSDSDDDKVPPKTKRVAKAPTQAAVQKKVVTGKTASGRAVTTTSHVNQVKKNVLSAAKKTKSPTSRKVAAKKEPVTTTLKAKKAVTGKKADAKKAVTAKKTDAKKPLSAKAQDVKKPASAPAKKPVAVKPVDGNSTTNRRKSTRK